MRNPKIINGQYYYDVWFEIFVTKDNGETQTIESVSNEEDISSAMDLIYQRNPEYKGKLNYDRWGCLDDEGWNIVQIT